MHLGARIAHAPNTIDAANSANPTSFVEVRLVFQAERSPKPSQFRAIHTSALATPDDPNQPLICDEFLPLRTDGSARWTLFATVKTTGYEQWLGHGALAFCQNPAVSWQPGDWTTTLQQEFDALR